MLDLKQMKLKSFVVALLLMVHLVGNHVFASQSIIYRQAEVDSNNYGSREEAIPSILHILYTGESLQDALQTFENPKEGVSVHYLIAEDGTIYRLVPESKTAFHAGKSHWGKIHSVNRHSIGIALVNEGISDEAAKQYGWKNTFPQYPKEQIEALVMLSKDIIKRWDIKPWNIVGHSDVAAQRKFDPGLSFPWAYLAKNGVGLWPKKSENCHKVTVNNSDFLEKVASYGYDVPEKHHLDSKSNNANQAIKNVILAFQAHFRPSKVDGIIDSETSCILNNLLKMKQKQLSELKK